MLQSPMIGLAEGDGTPGHDARIKELESRSRNQKAPDDAGAFKFFTTQGGNQYFATTGPLQLKR